MIVTKDLVVYVDGSREVGYGHLSRMSVLARRLPFSVKVVTRTATAARFFFDPQAFEIIPAASRHDVDKILANLSQGTGGVILDPPYDPHDPQSSSGEAWQAISRKLRGHQIPVVRITDEEIPSGHDCDILVNDHPIAVHFADRYSEMGNTRTALVGPQFFLIDPCHETAQIEPSGLFICFGGTDQNRLVRRFREAIFEIAREHDVTVVSNEPDIRQKELPENLRLHSNLSPVDLSSLVQGAALNLTASGNMLFERIYHQKPGLSLSQFPRQELIGRAFEAQGLTRHLGAGLTIEKNVLIDEIMNLMESDSRKMQQISACKKLDIAGGCAQVVSSVRNLIACCRSGDCEIQQVSS